MESHARIQPLRIAMTTQKQCGKCGKEVPASSYAGKHCPHCGIRWTVEKESFQNPPAVATQVGPTTSGDRKSYRAAGQSSESTTDRCGECKSEKESHQLTCPHCGHTEWGVIYFMAGFAVIFLIWAAWVYFLTEEWATRFIGTFTLATMGAGALIGALHSVYAAYTRKR